MNRIDYRSSKRSLIYLSAGESSDWCTKRHRSRMDVNCLYTKTVFIGVSYNLPWNVRTARKLIQHMTGGLIVFFLNLLNHMVMDREIRWRVKYDGQQTLCHNTTSGVSGDRRCINLINWKRFSIAWPYIYRFILI